MEEKNSKKGQELLAVDEKGKPVEKKEEKKPAKIQKLSLMYLSFFFGLVILGLFLRIFVFNKNTEKTKNYHKFKTAEDMYRNLGESINRNLGESIIRYIKQKPNAKIGLASGTTPEGLYNYLINNMKKGKFISKIYIFLILTDFVVFQKMIKIVIIML